MKSYALILIVCTLALLISCDKKEPDLISTPKVDKNGLTKNITDLVPQSILDEMKRLGMPIYGGATPPLLTTSQLQSITFVAKPFIIKNTNVPNDNTKFLDYIVTFRQQNNNDLTIQEDYITHATNGFTETGTGLGSFIVGDDCKFSVFTNIEATINGSKSKSVGVISGTLQPSGIENIYVSTFMIDNYGNPQNVWIGNGQGRVLYDTDGFSEVMGTTLAWHSNLPPCPCTYTQAKLENKTKCPQGEWSDCGTASADFHYGAAYEVRWLPSSSGRPGQQCTYDASGDLITGGIAAGSPDKVSPGSCGFWTWLINGNATTTSYLGHKTQDIDTWKSIPCWQYLENWPANNILSCVPNKVSSIDHMTTMVRSMSCEEVSLMIKKAKESPVLLIDPDLRNYIIGVPISLNNVQLKAKLQNWKSLNSCAVFPTEKLCLIIDKAIANL
jgi:hypothetical protein